MDPVVPEIDRVWHGFYRSMLILGKDLDVYRRGLVFYWLTFLAFLFERMDLGSGKNIHFEPLSQVHTLEALVFNTIIGISPVAVSEAF